MIRYFAVRVALMVPTLVAIIGINFLVVQLAPGGPIETVAAQMRQHQAATHQFAGPSFYQGGEGLDPAMIAKLDHQFGFDKPPLTRFGLMLKDYMTFSLGDSFFQGAPVAALIWRRLPVSVSLGLWSTLLVYLVSIPLGIHKAVHDGSRFDRATTAIIVAAYAVPGFLLAVFLLVLFGAGGWVALFPLRGLASPGAASWPWWDRVADYAWHLALPTVAMTAAGFATLTMLTKNSFLDEMDKLYVTAARARGLSEGRVLYGHVFRNAIIPILAGLPGAFTAILFSSALLVEIIFSVNGLGLLGYNAVLQRDYPVMFGTLYVYTLVALVGQLVTDLLYVAADPRIDFARKRK